MRNLTFILFIVITIFIIGVFLCMQPNVTLEHFDDNNNKDNNTNKISNQDSDKLTNIIQNGSFLNGKDIEGHYGSSNGNKIVVFSNPGSSSYCLRQLNDKNADPVQI